MYSLNPLPPNVGLQILPRKPSLITHMGSNGLTGSIVRIAKEVKATAEPLRRFLEEYYDSAVSVTVTTDRVEVKRGEFQTSFFEAGGGEEEDE